MAAVLMIGMKGSEDGDDCRRLKEGGFIKTMNDTMTDKCSGITLIPGLVHKMRAG